MPKTLATAASERGVAIYHDAKITQPVAIHIIPSLLTQAQCRYLQLLGTRIRRVLNRLLRTYFQDEAIQAVLPLSDDERSWLSQLAPRGFPEPSPVFERLDTNLPPDDPHWVDALQFLEFNAVGVGCLHFMPVANELIAEHVLPTFQNGLASCRASTDPRWLLRRMLETHAKALGRKHAVTAFVERREASEGGADEMRQVAEFLSAQGLPTVYADPRQLELRNGELVYKDTVVDLVYRDCTLSEILSIEKHGGDVQSMKHAFVHNQVISSLLGEFDHKSIMEPLSNPEFARYFKPSERRTFQAFIPWTRLLRERKTLDPSGREVDLPDHAKAHREALVLKPNRAYGGQDVVMGLDVTQAAWEEAIGKAVSQPDAYVLQEFVRLPQADFIGPNDPHRVVTEYVTIGFIATPDGISLLGRSCAERIVNISRGGNLVPMFIR